MTLPDKFSSTNFDETLDLTNPPVRAELVQSFASRFAHLHQETLKNRPFRQEDLAELFAEIVLSANPHLAAEYPSPEAWLYRHTAGLLLSRLPGKDRRLVRTRLVRILFEPPHNLSAPEISAVLDLRENTVAQMRHTNADILQAQHPPEFDLDIDELSRQISARIPDIISPEKTSKFNKIPRPLRETLWLLGGLGIILMMVIAFMRSDEADLGLSLFPTDTPQPPPLLEVTSPEIQSVPSLQNEDVANTYHNIDPIISDNGRYVLFASNHPLLVPDDTNNAYDVYLFDAVSGEIRRISLSDTGKELEGDSFAASMSSDGSIIVFTNVQNDGEMRVFLTDWKSRISRQINYFPDRTTISEAYSAGISGDGSTVAFWGNPRGYFDVGCAIDNPEYPCINLFIYSAAEDRLYTLFETGLPEDFWYTTRLPMSHDGAIIGLTLTSQNNLWSRLDSPNEAEAVLYNWRTEDVIPLNQTPAGEYGNDSSYKPLISGDASKAVFFADSSNLVPGDTNDRQDLFYTDLSNGEIVRINVTANGEQAEAVEEQPVDILYFNTPDLSADGSTVIFPSTAPNMVRDVESTFCMFGLNFGRSCYGVFVYSRDTQTTSQVKTGVLYEAGAQSQIGTSYSIADTGDKIALMMWPQGEECLTAGCSTIWFLDGSSARLISDIHPVFLAEPSLQPWNYSGMISGPERWVKGVAVDPGGSRLAMGDNDGSVLIRGLQDDQLAFDSQHSSDVNTVAFSPDGRRLAAGLAEGTVRIWNVENSELEFFLTDLPGIIFDLAFSPDGRFLAVGSQRALWIWEFTQGDLVLSQTYSQRMVNAAAFSPDSEWLAYASNEEVWVRRMSDGELVARLGGHTERVLDVAFSPGTNAGYLIATASQDGTALLWKLEASNGQPEIRYQRTLEHRSWVSALSFSPDGRLLAAGTFDSRIILWEMPEGGYRQILQRTRQDQILSLTFTPDGDTIFAGTVKGVRVWNRNEVQAIPEPVTDFFTFHDSGIFEETWPYTANWFSEEPVEATIVHTAEDALDARIYPPFPGQAILPDNCTLASIVIYKDTAGRTIGSAWVYQVTTNFQPARLTIFQTTLPLKEVDWPVSPEAEVVMVNVLDYEAELIFGGWGEPEAPRIGPDGGTNQDRQWNPEAASIFLRWKDEQMSYSIYYDQPFNKSFIPAGDLIAPQELLEIAESLYR